MPRILLVEDNELNRDALSRRLGRRGYDVTLATDGGEAVERARGDAPDLILMDMGLPTMSGWDASRRIKSDAALRAIPIIALTAHATAEDLKRALDAGCEDFDTKPIDFQRLLGKIEALLTGLPGQAPREAAPSPAAPSPVVAPRLVPLPEDAPSVLVIDDDREVQALMERILNKEGFRVQSASTAAEGMARVREAPPDVIVLDLMLTDRDGWSVLQELKGSQDLASIPVILLSMLSEPDGVAERGAEAYLMKPVDRGALSGVLHRCRPRRGA